MNLTDMAIEWAVGVTKEDGSVVLSDHFWSPFPLKKRAAIQKKLERKDILVFNGVPPSGAVLVHKRNPRLHITLNKDGVYGGHYLSGPNQSDVIMLMYTPVA